MPINFNDERNKSTYTGRTADESWTKAILSLDNPSGLRVADVGCGGGIYSRAWLALGAREVVGVDSSPNMVSAAADNCSDLSSVSFQVGDATSTGLTESSVDVVFQRALIHHLTDIRPCLEEAIRILKPGGKVIIQDRTPDDIALPGSSEHIRGYFFECFPRLLKIESGRRRTDEAVLSELSTVGFEHAGSMTVWETRKVYPFQEEFLEEVRQRKGRSILHELNDNEIESLTSFINERLHYFGEMVEKDRWTIWHATKPR
ncbi:MAG: class I SAM-dependent methyltransferase [Firmicutes bacterium]|nr:class I SAM-dependent methyltransferase [Bacillota bacterium]